MLRITHIFFILFLLTACNKHLAPTGYSYAEQKIEQTAPTDKNIDALVQPYRDSLDKEMSTVLAVADEALYKLQPESDLGNLMCELMLKKAVEYYKKPVDFTFMNYGGIRLPGLPKGNITLGEVIELMPFENRLVIMQLKGAIVDTLFNYMAAKGGWPVAGARYKIKNAAALDIFIGDQPLDRNKTYTVAVSDYIAQGGDNCNMLKNIGYTDLKKTIREALIEGLKDMTVRNEHVKSILDGRVQVVKE